MPFVIGEHYVIIKHFIMNKEAQEIVTETNGHLPSQNSICDAEFNTLYL